MTYLLLIINTILLIFLIFIFHKFNTLKKENIIKDIDESFIRLEIPKIKRPEISDVDPENKLLTDVLESIRLEKWNSEVVYDGGYSSDSYMLLLDNKKDISLRCRLYLRENNLSIGSFTLISKSGNISYNRENKETNYLILKELHKYIIEHHNSEWDKEFKYYEKLIKAIDSELLTINRDRKLNKIVNKI